ncbi:class I SAM-dependent methyltransferase [Oceanispirochaeta crateris]|uniref:Class I SAM-dependent methyltransferase n=1 Tax=Oceanispirochaeta crateris TaxID=2518645 RepID=A0A5C1QNP0_9SPIO|nr:class I SAM-dependent methyltransferase [Oceanispirochaeta crateris]QEN08186.1 class I SAM-dependent methyltransferase [Oceanispirochaeta crateris]
MSEFWKTNFRDKNEMWGASPADAAFDISERFSKYKLNHILIPGFGYGRNAIPFLNKGMKVTGIEISRTAIELAQKRLENDVKIYHDSVSSMPFDEEQYDGIFCYALIHLLDESERVSLINNCFNQLSSNGYMIFIALSSNDSRYGKGLEVKENTFQTKHGINLFFYNIPSIQEEFGKYGLVEFEEINEPTASKEGKPVEKFWQIVCKKK